MPKSSKSKAKGASLAVDGGIVSATTNKEVTMTNKSASQSVSKFFVQKDVATRFHGINEPLTASETGEKEPVQEAVLGGIKVRVWDDLFAILGTLEKGTFVSTYSSYNQITGLVTGFESLLVGGGTYRSGVHSHYDIAKVRYVSDEIMDFCYVRFSRMSVADQKWFSKLGIADDGKHEDRWVSLTAKNGNLSFGYSVKPIEASKFVAYMMAKFTPESAEAYKAKTGKDGRVVRGKSDVTRFDWKRNDKMWAVTLRHNAIDELLQVQSGDKAIRVKPTLFEKSNGQGFSVEEQATRLANGIFGWFNSAEEISNTRKGIVQDIRAREKVSNTKHVLANKSGKYNLELSANAKALLETGKLPVLKGKKVTQTKGSSLISVKGEKPVKLAMVYTNGVQPIAGGFSVYDVEDLASAQTLADLRGLVLTVSK